MDSNSTKPMELHFTRTNGPADIAIDNLMEMVGGIRRPELVREMILAALKAGQEDDLRADLKLMSVTLKELRFTSKIFGDYRNVKKVTVFGSARIRPEEKIYKMAHRFGRELSEHGFMVITGGGAGIMQAVNEGAGSEFSFGANIRLPFEQRANPILLGSPRNIMYKYFFNRKVAFLKESDGVALFPGGFGTLDEAMECLTLLQTGKRNPMPLVLIEEPGGTYWSNWIHLLEDELLRKGYVSKSDFHLFERFDSVEDAVRGIACFYDRYHSLRYVGDRLAIRMTSGLDSCKIEELQKQYKDILYPGGKIYASGPLPEEADEPELKDLPRLIIDFDRRDFGRLRCLINEINCN